VEQQRKRNGEGNGLAPKLINAAGRAVTGEMGMSQMYRLNAATGSRGWKERWIPFALNDLIGIWVGKSCAMSTLMRSERRTSHEHERKERSARADLGIR
jgi:hypothetical protein